MNTTQQIMDFGGQELEGTTWGKPDGSDHFTIRSILIGEEGLSIQTTDGRLISGDVMETYVQSDGPISIPKEAPVYKIDTENLDELSTTKADNFGSLKYQHDVQFANPTGTRHHPIDPINDPIGEPSNTGSGQPTQSTRNVEYLMIDKVLGKYMNDELAAVTINPITTVDNGIHTLHDVLNIDHKDIHEYMVQRLTNHIQDMVSKSVDAYLSGLGITPAPVETTE